MSEKSSSVKRLVRESHSGEYYEYYPLGEHVVVAPGVCGGRPTFKYTRMEVSVVLSLIASGETIEQIVEDYAYSQLTTEAIQEAIYLAGTALIQSAESIYPTLEARSSSPILLHDIA